ncbi:MAG: GNAT family N-acetyltransferase [Planctomycetes bacterium]|nr:GNAT family N-acetyltransferase [Planctomycetota bacterium]
MSFSTKRSVITRKPPPPGAVELLRPSAKPEAISLDRQTRIRPVRPEEIDQALELLLTDPNDSTEQVIEKIKYFQQLAGRQQYDLSKQIVALHDDKLVSASLFVPQPGQLAFVFQSSPVNGALDMNIRELAVLALKEMCRWAFQEGNRLLQMIVEPEDRDRQELCRAGGFNLLTNLQYMIHDGEHNPLNPPEKKYDWLCYDRSRHDLFQKIITETYQGSHDCPELEDIRDIEDVISSHRAAGRFDYKLWKLLVHQGNPIGALLLIPLSDSQAMELTYMGLSPEARGMHLGDVLIAEALACAKKYQRRFLTLAVDQRNHFACRLYQKFGFEEIFQRTVLIYSAPK